MREKLVTGEIYHVMNKSIEGYTIFHTNADYVRMMDMSRYFMYKGVLPKFSKFRARKAVQDIGFAAALNGVIEGYKRHVDIISYCLMPTHVHFMLRQQSANGISVFMSNLLNTYTRYFNSKRKRRGPLWMSRFKSVRVTSDEQALHLTRYIHLNPATAGIVRKPEKWNFSSYAEFISPEETINSLCIYGGLFDIDPKEYQAFVNDHASDQKDLAIIKHTMLD